MTIRTIAFVILGLALGGCMQETLEPATQASWNARDKQLMANLPYAQAAIPIRTSATSSTTRAKKRLEAS